MVTRNPNWLAEILWYGTGYGKGKILSVNLRCKFSIKLKKCFKSEKEKKMNDG
jgi:hypothetical protein